MYLCMDLTLILLYDFKECTKQLQQITLFHVDLRFTSFIEREKERDLTQSYYKSPYTNRNVKKAKWNFKREIYFDWIWNLCSFVL